MASLPLVKEIRKLQASASELDTDVETSAPLHLCHQNTTATKHLELVDLKTKQSNRMGKKRNIISFCKDFQIHPGN